MHVCGVTRSNMRHNTFTGVIGCIRVYSMTFTYVTGRIRICDMTHPQECRDAFVYVTRLTRMTVLPF